MVGQFNNIAHCYNNLGHHLGCLEFYSILIVHSNRFQSGLVAYQNFIIQGMIAV